MTIAYKILHNTNVGIEYREIMLNGITNNGILNSQVEKNNEVFGVTNPIKNAYSNVDKGLFIDETNISSQAMQLYQRDTDIKNFTTLALSNPEDTSHNEMVQNLFENGVTDVLAEETVNNLSSNTKLLDDLEL